MSGNSGTTGVVLVRINKGSNAVMNTAATCDTTLLVGQKMSKTLLVDQKMLSHRQRWSWWCQAVRPLCKCGWQGGASIDGTGGEVGRDTKERRQLARSGSNGGTKIMETGERTKNVALFWWQPASARTRGQSNQDVHDLWVNKHGPPNLRHAQINRKRYQTNNS